ncbi:hypothetical protein [Xenorhabdus griffiniae]|uniref:Uncharacterized protein n=1 Tax=Xenorhabdus griffiniae TaxID=351672 RepID=A0ABY9XMI2_9GAMM|nr:hypothetical protein [Xenorhabdus griffiniae]MBD1228591.1 hypothetical protein [Xenorhabdus griffiniae]MBE8588116.1 hypothetical protein [Xenorhabdus griffiniae]WMV74085.1 hypothetical protein QL128_08885 [Xenorhabdus griffiniae]WNH03765.1 hypothetical protein QL112_008890 [Xenorhabdus griffiniae]
MEKFTDKLISFDRFILRILSFLLHAFIIFLIGIIPGVLGFFLIESHAISDAILNSVSMIGTQNLHIEPVSTLGKYFAAIYGLFLQAIFFIAVGMVVTPFVHRILHSWHIDNEDNEDVKK